MGRAILGRSRLRSGAAGGVLVCRGNNSTDPCGGNPRGNAWVPGRLPPKGDIGQIRTNDDVGLTFGIEQAHLCVGFISDDFGLGQGAGPVIRCGQIDHVTFEKVIGGDNFWIESTGHYASSFLNSVRACAASRGARP